MGETIIFIDGSNFYRQMESSLKQSSISIDLKQYIFDYKGFVNFLGGEDLKETRYYNVRLMRYINPVRFKKQRSFFNKLEQIPNFRVIKGTQVKKRPQNNKMCLLLY